MIITDGIPNENNEFEDIIIQFEIFVPMTQWIIKDTNLLLDHKIFSYNNLLKKC